MINPQFPQPYRRIQNPGSRGGVGFWKRVRHEDGSEAWEWVYGRSSGSITKNESVTTERGKPSAIVADMHGDATTPDIHEDRQDQEFDGDEEEAFHYGVPTYYHDDGQITIGGLDSHVTSSGKINAKSAVETAASSNFDYLKSVGLNEETHGNIEDFARSLSEKLQYSPKNEDAPSTTARLQIKDGIAYIPMALQALVIQQMRTEIMSLVPKSVFTRDDPASSYERDEQDPYVPETLELEQQRADEEDPDDDIRSLTPESFINDQDNINKDTYNSEQDPLQTTDTIKRPDIIKDNHWLNENKEGTKLFALMDTLAKKHQELNGLTYNENADSRESAKIEEKSITLDDFLKIVLEHKLHVSNNGVSYFGGKNPEEALSNHVEKAHQMAITADMLGFQIVTANSIDLPDAITGLIPGLGPVKDNEGIQGGSPLVYFMKGNKGAITSTKSVASILGDPIPSFRKNQVEVLKTMLADERGFLGEDFPRPANARTDKSQQGSLLSQSDFTPRRWEEIPENKRKDQDYLRVVYDRMDDKEKPTFLSKEKPLTQSQMERRTAATNLAMTLDKLGLHWTNPRWTQIWSEGSKILDDNTAQKERISRSSTDNRREISGDQTVKDVNADTIEQLFEEHIVPAIEKKELDAIQKAKEFGQQFLLCSIIPENTSKVYDGGYSGFDPSEMIYENRNEFDNPVLFIPDSQKSFDFNRDPEDYTNGTKGMDMAPGESLNDFEKRFIDTALNTKITKLFKDGGNDVRKFIKQVNSSITDDGIESMIRDYSLQPVARDGILKNLAESCKAWAAKTNTEIVTPLSMEKYPALLRNIGEDAPQLLFIRHNGLNAEQEASGQNLLYSLASGQALTVGGVGTRNMGTDKPGSWSGANLKKGTQLIGNGFVFAASLAAKFAQNNWVMISGLAHGTDSICHKFAMSPDGKTPSGYGKTVAILGEGLNSDAENVPVLFNASQIKDDARTTLMNEILANGGLIISERLPGESPSADYLLKRNRLQSGMSLGTIAFETPETRIGKTYDTGTMRTAASTTHQGRILATIDPESWHRNSSSYSDEQKELADILISGNKRIILENGAYGIKYSVGEEGKRDFSASFNDLVSRMIDLKPKLEEARRGGTSLERFIPAYRKEDVRQSWEHNYYQRGIERDGSNLVISPYAPEVLRRAFDYVTQTQTIPGNFQKPKIDWQYASSSNETKRNGFSPSMQLQQSLSNVLVLFQTHFSSRKMSAIVRAMAIGKKIYADTNDTSPGNSGVLALTKGVIPKRSNNGVWLQNGPKNYWKWNVDDLNYSAEYNAKKQIHDFNNGISLSKEENVPDRKQIGVAASKRMRFDPRIKSSTYVLGAPSSPIRIEVKRQTRAYTTTNRTGGQTTLPVMLQQIMMFREGLGGKKFVISKHTYYYPSNVSSGDGIKKFNNYVDSKGKVQSMIILAEYTARRQRFQSIAKEQASANIAGGKKILASKVKINGSARGLMESTGPVIEPNGSPLDHRHIDGYAHDQYPEFTYDDSQKNIPQDAFDDYSASTSNVVSKGDEVHINCPWTDDAVDSSVRQVKSLISDDKGKPKVVFPGSTFVSKIFDGNKNHVWGLKASNFITSMQTLFGKNNGYGSEDFSGINSGRVQRAREITGLLGQPQQISQLAQQWFKNLAKSNVMLYFVPQSPLMFAPIPTRSLTTTGKDLSMVVPAVTFSSSKDANDILFLPQARASQDTTVKTKDTDTDDGWKTKLLDGKSGTITKSKELGFSSSVNFQGKDFETATQRRPSTFVVIGTTTTGNPGKDLEHMYLAMGMAANVGFANNIGASRTAPVVPLSEQIDGLMTLATDQLYGKKYVDAVVGMQDSDIASSDQSLLLKQKKAIFFAKAYMRYVSLKTNPNGIAPFPEIDDLATNIPVNERVSYNAAMKSIKAIADRHCEASYSPNNQPSIQGKSLQRDVQEKDERDQPLARDNILYTPRPSVIEKVISNYTLGLSQRLQLTDFKTITVEGKKFSDLNKKQKYQWIDKLSEAVGQSQIRLNLNGRNTWNFILDMQDERNAKVNSLFDNFGITPDTGTRPPGIGTFDDESSRVLALYGVYSKEKEMYEKWANNPDFEGIRRKLFDGIKAKKLETASPDSPITRGDVVERIKEEEPNDANEQNRMMKAIFWRTFLTSEYTESAGGDVYKKYLENMGISMPQQISQELQGHMDTQTGKVKYIFRGGFSNYGKNTDQIPDDVFKDPARATLSFTEWTKKILGHINGDQSEPFFNACTQISSANS